jgi:hypothetical protein
VGSDVDPVGTAPSNLAQTCTVAERDQRRPQLAEELNRLGGVKLGHVADRPNLGVQEAFGHGCRVADAGGLEGSRGLVSVSSC